MIIKLQEKDEWVSNFQKKQLGEKPEKVRGEIEGMG